MSLLRLFTYGSLKRGGSNFERFCEGASRIDEAYVVGRLHFFPPRYPILDVPSAHVVGQPSGRLRDDIALLEQVKAAAPAWASGEWLRIRGEVMEFADDAEVERRLARIDWLEDFHVEGPVGYQRVLLPVERADGAWLPAWGYVIPADARGRYRLLDGDEWSERSPR